MFKIRVLSVPLNIILQAVMSQNTHLTDPLSSSDKLQLKIYSLYFVSVLKIQAVNTFDFLIFGFFEIFSLTDSFPLIDRPVQR